MSPSVHDAQPTFSVLTTLQALAMAIKRKMASAPGYGSKYFRRTRSTSVEDKQRPNFLKLPPEPRNYIYDLSLVQTGIRIQVTPQLKIPGLLASCQQIRQEAIRIYWLQNEFEVKIFDHDVRVWIRFSILLCGLEELQ
ncbi:hypothetical protein CLAFUR0_04373 [Fulvia fulva]|nr:hypothetical protein CLAFUR0_04373 [Fulvia fulva]